MQKRFPHRFLPSAGAPGVVHSTCQSAPGWVELQGSAQRGLGKAFIGWLGLRLDGSWGRGQLQTLSDRI